MMKVKAKTGRKGILGTTMHTLHFVLECEDQEFRDDVYNMVVAALSGSKVIPTEEKTAVLGFQAAEQDE